MSRFRSSAPLPDVVVSLTEVWAAWSGTQPSSHLHLVDLKPPLAAPQLPAHAEACQQDIRARLAVQGVPRTLWVLSSFWLNTWVQAFPTGVASMRELENLVRGRATQLFGPAPDGQAWAISADWKSHGHFLCHAAPASLMSVLGKDVLQSPLTLALQAAARLKVLQTQNGFGWMVFTAPGETHLMALQNGYPFTLVSRRVPLDQNAQETLRHAMSIWRVEQARTNQRAERLYWLDGASHQPVRPDELPQSVIPLEAPWQQPVMDAVAMPPAGQWLARVIGMQQALA